MHNFVTMFKSETKMKQKFVRYCYKSNVKKPIYIIGFRIRLSVS